MEITESMVYWITRLDAIKAVTEGIGVAGVVVMTLFVPLISAAAADLGVIDGEVAPTVKKVCKKALPLWIVCLFLAIGSIFIPTTKEMCAIKVLPLIVNHADMRGLPKDISELAHEWLEELKPKKDK